MSNCSKERYQEMPSSEHVSTKLEQIASRAKVMSGVALTSLSHIIDIEFLREAYRRTRKNGATGIDHQTAEQFADNLEDNLQGLLTGFKSGSYKAPAVRRVYIPKSGGKLRPLGIPTFADKVLQTAVKMILETVYETDFRDCSYGFRPGRSQHDALEAVWQSLKWDGGWVVEIDFESFFDSLSHQHLRQILDARVRDGSIRKMIDKWLKAGIFEEGSRHIPTAGTPQGGVVSPILSNIYLHHVLDEWFEDVVKPMMRRTATSIRFADDGVYVFKDESDARRFLAVLPKRCAKFGLTLHPEKTRLVKFFSPGRKSNDSSRSWESFNFLGLTHYWGKNRKGRWVHQRKTQKGRLRKAINAANLWCRTHRHRPVSWQSNKLRIKLMGHYRYYGVTGNCRALVNLLHAVKRLWFVWLRRRGQRRRLTWDKYNLLLDKYPLPKPIVYQSIYKRAVNART